MRTKNLSKLQISIKMHDSLFGVTVEYFSQNKYFGIHLKICVLYHGKGVSKDSHPHSFNFATLARRHHAI